MDDYVCGVLRKIVRGRFAPLVRRVAGGGRVFVRTIYELGSRG